MFEHLDQELQNLAARSLCRRLTEVEEVLPGGRVRVNGRVLLNLSSNDYLGLSIDPRLINAAGAAAARWGVGAGASRLVTGHLSLHREVEERLAAFKGTAAAVIFSTGYMANLGVISALVGPGDTVFCDRLNHASIYDGIKLSGAILARFPHRDLDRLENLLHQAGPGQRLIITDSVFSVDGDLAPLQGLVDLKDRYDAALMVDEAHATGVLGPGGGPGRGIGTHAADRYPHGHFLQGSGVAGGIRGRGPAPYRLPAQPAPVVHLFHGPAAPGPGGHRRGPEHRERGAGEAPVLAGRGQVLSGSAYPTGFDCLGSDTQMRAGIGGRQRPDPEIRRRPAGAWSHGRGLPSAHGDPGAGPGAVFPVGRPLPGGSHAAREAIIQVGRKKGLIA